MSLTRPSCPRVRELAEGACESCAGITPLRATLPPAKQRMLSEEPFRPLWPSRLLGATVAAAAAQGLVDSVQVCAQMGRALLTARLAGAKCLHSDGCEGSS